MESSALQTGTVDANLGQFLSKKGIGREVEQQQQRRQWSRAASSISASSSSSQHYFDFTRSASNITAEEDRNIISSIHSSSPEIESMDVGSRSFRQDENESVTTTTIARDQEEAVLAAREVQYLHLNRNSLQPWARNCIWMINMLATMQINKNRGDDNITNGAQEQKSESNESDGDDRNQTPSPPLPATPPKAIHSTSTMTATIHACSQTHIRHEKVPLRQIRRTLFRTSSSMSSSSTPSELSEESCDGPLEASSASQVDSGAPIASIEELSIVGRRLDLIMLRRLVGRGNKYGGSSAVLSKAKMLLQRSMAAAPSAAPVHYLSRMQKLVLNGNQLDDRAWSRCLQRLPPNLRELNLSWNSIGPKGASALARCLSRNIRKDGMATLHTLRLNGNPLGPKGIKALVDNGQIFGIQRVDLWDTQLGDEGTEILGLALARGSGRCESLDQGQRGVRIEHLNLDMNEIGSVGISGIAKWFKHKHCSLKSLRLYCNNIQDGDVQVLMEALAAKPTLPTNMGSKYGCPFCNTRDDWCCSSCSSSCEHCNRRGLIDLSLCANQIGPLGAAHIATYLGETHLERLHLSHNHIGDTGAQALSVALSGGKPIVRADGDNASVIDCSYLDEVSKIVSVQDSIPVYRRPRPLPLKVLALSCNELGNKSAAALASALRCKQTQQLEELSLVGNSSYMDRRGASAFAPCLQHFNTTLKKLQLLEDTHENHLLKEKLDMYLEFNRLGRRHLGDSRIPNTLWPVVFGRQEQNTKKYQNDSQVKQWQDPPRDFGHPGPSSSISIPIVKPDHLYMILQGRPDLVRT